MNETKKCAFCGTVNEKDAGFCSSCGGSEFVAQPATVSESFQTSVYTPTIQSPEIPAKDNILLGIIGAFIFSLVGAAIYFGVYQLGYIAGICGFLMYWLASFGYDLFNGKKKIMTTPRIVVSVIMMLVMIFVAEWACVINVIIQSFKEVFGSSIGIGAAIEWIPTFMADGEFAGAVAKDFVFAYILGIVAVVGEVISFVKSKKNPPAPTNFQPPMI